MLYNIVVGISVNDIQQASQRVLKTEKLRQNYHFNGKCDCILRKLKTVNRNIKTKKNLE